MRDVSPVALFDSAPMVLGEIVRPAPANKVDHVAAFECGDHQVDGSVRSPFDFSDLLRSIHRAENRTGLRDLVICMAVCSQLGVSINTPFPEALIPQFIALADAIKA